MDIQNLQATDLPFNPRVMMPQVLRTEEEVKLTQLVIEVEKIMKEMAEKTSDWSNLKKRGERLVEEPN